jgi:hypothetical protein
LDRSTDELASAITLLLGAADEKFVHERELRMFQFQCWLLDNGSQNTSFRDSALKFGTALLGTTISRIRTEKRMGARNSFLLASASRNLEGIVNFCFARRDNLYPLLEIDNFPLRQPAHDTAVEEIADLNNLVETRVRLHLASERASLNAAKRLLPTMNPQSRRRTGISEVEKKRRKRESFLLAAKCVAPVFLAMDFESTGGKNRLITPEGLLSQTAKKANDQEAFTRLCSAAKAIAPIIDFEWSAEVAKALDSVEAVLPELAPIPTELLPKKPPRRAAAETKKANRKQVGN